MKLSRRIMVGGLILSSMCLTNCGVDETEQPRDAAGKFNSRSPNDVHEALVSDAISFMNKWDTVRFDKENLNEGNDGTDQNSYILIDYYRSAYPYLTTFPEYAGMNVTPESIPEAHFVRNTDPKSPYTIRTSRAACERAKELIVKATTVAFIEFDSGYMNFYNFFLGHATHIIQDAFPTNHVSRGNRIDRHTLYNVCVGDGDPVPTFGCSHGDWEASLPAGGDYITDHTNPNYVAARNATIGYLQTVAFLQKWARPENRSIDIPYYLEPFFHGTIYPDLKLNAANMNYFNCAKLSDIDTVR